MYLRVCVCAPTRRSDFYSSPFCARPIGSDWPDFLFVLPRVHRSLLTPTHIHRYTFPDPLRTGPNVRACACDACHIHTPCTRTAQDPVLFVSVFIHRAPLPASVVSLSLHFPIFFLLLLLPPFSSLLFSSSFSFLSFPILPSLLVYLPLPTFPFSSVKSQLSSRVFHLHLAPHSATNTSLRVFARTYVHASVFTFPSLSKRHRYTFSA